MPELQTAEDLIAAVHDFFVNQYKATTTDPSGGVKLAFEPIGTPVSPASFKLNPADPAPNPVKAVEACAGITNNVPTVSKGTYYRSDRTLDGFYNLLLGGAQPVSADRMPLFSQVVGDAKRRFPKDPLGSIDLGDSAGYRPIVATPADWYDPAVASNWLQQSFKQAAPAPSAPAQPAPTGDRSYVRSQWRVLPATLSAVATTGMVMTDAPHETPPPPPVQVQPVSPKVFQPQLHFRSLPRVAMVQPVTAFRSAGVQSFAATADLRISPAVMALRNAGVSDTAVAVQPLETRRLDYMRIDASSRVSAALLSNTTPQPVQSNSLSISFEYCIVQIARPWLTAEFLHLRGWCVPGYEAGGLLKPIPDDAGGEALPCLPIAFIVTRNVTLSANWSQADLDAAHTSLGFGPFSLVGRTISTGGGGATTITQPGMQILAWICQPLPALPPDGDPSLPGAPPPQPLAVSDAETPAAPSPDPAAAVAETPDATPTPDPAPVAEAPQPVGATDAVAPTP